MDLLTFISDPPRKQKLAEATKSSEGYLWQVATGWRKKRASPELAKAIEEATAKIGPEAVPKSSLRPDLWAADQQGAAPLARRITADAEATAEAAPAIPVSEAA